MAKPPLGVTLTVPDGQEATGFYNDPDGVEAFITDEPYLVDDGLQSPLPVFDAGGPVFQDSMGNAQASIALNGIDPPEPILPGPMDYADPRMGAFNDYTGEFGLASPTAVLGFVCDFDGDPVITITHGDEPLTILHQERRGGILSLIAAGTGLTVEVAELKISAAGGNLNGGAFRINEIETDGAVSFGWNGGGNAAVRTVSTPPMDGTEGGVVKSAYGTRTYDPYHNSRIIGATAVWQGFLDTGPVTEVDYGPSGPWVLGDGWSWDGDDLVHTGPESIATLTHPIGTGYSSSARAYIIVETGANCGITVYQNNYVSRNGPYEGPVYSSVAGKMDTLKIRARGQVRVTSVAVSGDTRGVNWVFGTAPAQDGEVFTGTSSAYGPNCVISAAEIVGGIA